MRSHRLALAAVCVAVPLTVLAQGTSAPTATVDKVVTDGFKSAAPDWQARLQQDETQKVCSASRNKPDAAAARAIRQREKATIVYPADGKFLGDWKKGEALAQSGYGLRFTDYPPRGGNGGNCYACHQLDRKELSYGTLGPSLADYGKLRKFADAAAKIVYEQIYNPHAGNPCVNMPRFGANKVLTVEQITDLVAYLMSPDSPVNK